VAEGYDNELIAFVLKIEGLVQGVGFRPFVYRLALEHGLTGWVTNRNDGVLLKVQGPGSAFGSFMEGLRSRAPAAAQIDAIEIEPDWPEAFTGFEILPSIDQGNETSEVSPDIAVCPECLADMIRQPHRRNYPFVNCTNCGPRFSIISAMPYDRSHTSMAPFELCPDCQREYNDIHDRRFHAQPVACNQCGPRYELRENQNVIAEYDQVISRLATLLLQGGIVAVKGIGGYHLMCHANSEEAVSRLRRSKEREGKPFAVMFANAVALRKYAQVSDTEQLSLESWHRPIVILQTHRMLAPSVSMQLPSVGAFLPYMPVHYQLFERTMLDAFVLTSGNVSDEPVIISDEEALRVLPGIADAVLLYNREILNRTDDSVVRIIGNRERLFRRSRGYAPSPVRINMAVDGILATGAELSNSFCLGKGNRAYVSQHIGDVSNVETFDFFRSAIQRYCELFRTSPSVVAADMHPDYLTTRYALELELPVTRVQHHHAHIASCMAENGISEPVIGVAFDGTGYGTDGHIWGGEFLLCDSVDFDRLVHFEYMQIPGGDQVVNEPWRTGLSLLRMAYGENMPETAIHRSVSTGLIKSVTLALRSSINCPLSSAAGRLFDAVAAITGLCTHSTFHAEAPMRLEAAIDLTASGNYPFSVTNTLSFLETIRAICNDLANDVPVGTISLRFHNTLAQAARQAVNLIGKQTGISVVALSGGVFQNRYLSETIENMLHEDGFDVITHSRVPCNDGGLALGQLLVSAARRRKEESLWLIRPK